MIYAGSEQAAPAEALRQRLLAAGWTPGPVQVFAGQAVEGEGVVFRGRSARAQAQAAGRKPYLFAASSQVAGALAGLSADWSQRLFLAYPFTPQDWTEQGRAALNGLRQRQGLDGRQAALQVSTRCC